MTSHGVHARFDRRLLLTASLVAALAPVALFLAACGDDEASGGSQGETIDVAFFGAAAENAYTQFMFEGAKEEAEAVNAELQFFDGKFDGAHQIPQMQDAISSGKFDGFIVMPNDPAGTVPVAEQAIAEGIKVAALQFPIGSDPTEVDPQVEGITTSVIEDVVRNAEVTAEGINAMCQDRDPCEVGILWGSRQVPFEAPKVEALKTSLDPDVRIVAEADAGFLQAPGQKATADMLQAHPGLDVLATPSGDQMTIGGQRAIEAIDMEIGLADRPDDAIAIVGSAGSETGVERVREGVWYQTYVLVPQTMARKAVKTLAEDIRGNPPSESDQGILQTELSPVGDVVTRKVLEEHPGWVAEWDG